ncbi:hypothetical protein CDL15_Pgr025982 [Punica granatum]|uniref:Uncharacterized protein n=1 Tax=Punica granatum TaxID=22663 RepID=A0A218WDI0_PUNGR|nr:hypothetical protein CDL15_Pgr025982 [Punica granatum]
MKKKLSSIYILYNMLCMFSGNSESAEATFPGTGTQSPATASLEAAIEEEQRETKSLHEEVEDLNFDLTSLRGKPRLRVLLGCPTISHFFCSDKEQSRVQT